MKTNIRLWQIFCPVVSAFICLIGVFLFPWQVAFSSGSVYNAAVSQNSNVFRGQEVKQTAFSGRYVPFYGSSELSRIDPLHPSVLAKKYHRSYTPFLLGGPGSQSLAQFFGMQETNTQLTGKKAVFIVSPQWFTKQSQNPQAFSLYFSHLQAIDWILSAHDSVGTRYAARRLLEMPSGTSSYTVKYALMTLASGRPLSDHLRLWLKIRRRMLVNEDTFFTLADLKSRDKRIDRAAAVLPSKYSVTALHHIADNQGAYRTTNNRFGIDNDFFKHRLNGNKIAGLYHSQKDFDYIASPEYADFQLVLQQFAKNHQNVLFVIPPVNEKWARYTGLSLSMYQQTVNKIKRQLVAQGFYHIADLSKDGGKKYFMQDTIHLGWNGWLALDHYVKPFMSQRMLTPGYRLSDYYYTKNWQNKANVAPVKIKTSTTMHSNANQIKAALAQNQFQGTALIIKNGKTAWTFHRGYANIAAKKQNGTQTSYLINSVQKSLTAVLVMRAVQNGQLKLTDRLSQFYPDVPHANKITLAQMLRMMSGLTQKPGTQLGASPFVSDQENMAFNVENAIFLKKYYQKSLYSSLNYVLLSGILEKVTHSSYENLFTKTFITPLHLKHTAFMWASRSQLDQIGLATSYAYVRNGHTKTKTLKETALNLNEIHGELGAGSVAMSDEDLAHVLKAVFDGRLLTASSRSVLFKGKAPAYYNGGFYNLKNFHAANGAGYGYNTFVRVANSGNDILILQSNQPISSFWTMRTVADQIMRLVSD